MKKSRLMELAGIANQRNTLNENSPALQNVIAQLTDELADEIEGAEDPMGIMLPRILDKLKKVVADPNSGLGPDDIAKIKNEIKVFSELMTKYSTTSIAQELADMNEARTEVIKEADVKVIPSAAGGDIQMTVTFENAIKYFEESAEEMGLSVDLNDASTQQKMAELMRDDLENWLGNNGAQWIEDGMNYDVYDDLDTGLGSR